MTLTMANLKNIIRNWQLIQTVEEIMLRDNVERLRSALCYLSETQKRRVIKYFFYGKTLERIADEEGVNFTSVRESINSSIKKLRKFF